MKNESNLRNSQRGISGMCAFALGLILATSLPAGAVTQSATTNGWPGVSVAFSTPAGGGFRSTSNYMHVNAIAVYAAPYNGDRNWSISQKIIIDWVLMYYDPQKGWTRWDALNNLGTWVGTTWIPAPAEYVAFTAGASRTHLLKAARVFPTPVVAGYYYTVMMRIAWINPATSQPMAAGQYWFNQGGDLQCVNGTYNCSPYTVYGPSGTPAPGFVQSIYFRY